MLRQCTISLAALGLVLGMHGTLAVGRAVLQFERGDTHLALFRRRDGFLWFHGRKPFGPPLAATAAAFQFLGDLCEFYNYTLDLALPPPGGEQAWERRAQFRS